MSCLDGERDGGDVGEIVGAEEGCEAGVAVIRAVGDVVGDEEGGKVGFAFPFFDGDAVGPFVGESDGAAVGDVA